MLPKSGNVDHMDASSPAEIAKERAGVSSEAARRAAEQKAKDSPPRGAWATHAALLVVQIAFGSQAVEAKIAMLDREHGGEAISPDALAMMRMVGAAIFFQLVMLVRRGRGERGGPIPRVDHARIMALAVLGIALNQALFLAGLRWTSPISAGILIVTIPVFSAALAVGLRKEPFVLRTMIGLAFAIGGVLSLTGIRALDRGAILVALNCLSYAAYVVLSRDVVVRIGAFRLMAIIFVYGAILFAPIGLRPMVEQIPEITARGWAYLAYIIAMPTIVAYALNAWALGRSSATIVTAYITIQPLVASGLARIQLGHEISPRAALAALLILVGLAVVMTRAQKIASS